MAARKKPTPAVIPSLIDPPTGGDLMARVSGILDQARANVVRAVNSNMVIAYWLIGREIVQALQGGEERAEYGAQVLSELSRALTGRYGRGFSVTNLKYFRLFYQAYSERQPQIRHEPRDELPSLENGALLDDLSRSLEVHDSQQGFARSLSWTHYRGIM